jgi:hypothetical protein
MRCRLTPAFPLTLACTLAFCPAAAQAFNILTFDENGNSNPS